MTTDNTTQPIPDPVPLVSTSPAITLTPAPQLWVDETEHVSGICFEAAWDAAERIFIIRNAEEHVRFYDLADNSQLCRRPVGRVPRDFSNGYTLVGFWSKGRGCKANHTVENYLRYDDMKTILVDVTFTTEGECPYDLLRPFWIGISGAADYEITVIIQ